MSLPRRLWLWFWAQPYLLLTLTMLMWAGNAISSRLAVGNVSPMALTSLRWIGVCGVMTVLFRHQLVAYAPLLRRRWRLYAAMGACGFTAFNTLMYLAAYRTTAINMGLTQGAIPIFVLIGSLVVYATRITPLQIVGVVVTLLGVVFVATKGDPAIIASLSVNIGDLAMIVAGLFYAVYTVALRERPEMPALVFFTALALIASVVSLPLFLWEIASGQAFWPTLQGSLIILYVALCPSLTAQLLFIRSVELIGPGRAGIFVNLLPVFAAILAVVLLHEPFSWYHAAALALVLGGIGLAELGKTSAAAPGTAARRSVDMELSQGAAELEES